MTVCTIALRCMQSKSSYVNEAANMSDNNTGKKNRVFIDSEKLLLIFRTVQSVLLLFAILFAFVYTSAYLIKLSERTYSLAVKIAIPAINCAQIINAVVGFFGNQCDLFH